MNFLDFLTTEPHELVSYFTLEKIEMAISRSCNDREQMHRILSKIKYEKDALEFYEYVLQNQLIPGFHYTPHTVREKKIAIQFLIDKDDYSEQRFQRQNKIHS